MQDEQHVLCACRSRARPTLHISICPSGVISLLALLVHCQLLTDSIDKQDALLKALARLSHKSDKHDSLKKESPEDPAHTNYHEPKSMSELAQLLNNRESDDRVVIDFYATWCPPCRRIEPIWKDLSKEHPNVSFIKVNVDKLGDAAETMSVEAMPTFVAFKGTEEVGRLVGAGRENLTNLIKNLDS